MITIPRCIGFLSIVALLAFIIVPLTMRRASSKPMVNAFERTFHKVSILLLACLLVATLTACETTDTKLKPLEDVVLAPPPPTTVNVPEETLKPCSKIPRLQERPYAEGEVLGYMQNNVTVQSDCRKRQKDAVKTIRRSLNVNTEVSK